MNSLNHIRQAVSCLQPGQRITVREGLLRSCQPPSFCFPVERAEDMVLESIVGSAYEFWYWEDQMSGNVTFGRLEKPLDDGRRTFVSPDRRDFYRRDGIYWIPLQPRFDYVAGAGWVKHDGSTGGGVVNPDYEG